MCFWLSTRTRKEGMFTICFPTLRRHSVLTMLTGTAETLLCRFGASLLSAGAPGTCWLTDEHRQLSLECACTPHKARHHQLSTRT